MYDMVNIFEVFLPQLLRYPNPTDPLNGEAAALMMRDETSYNAKVKGEFLSLSTEFIPAHMPTLSRTRSLGSEEDGLEDAILDT